MTGAAGFIGRNVCRALLADGCEIVGLVRTIPPEADRITDVEYVIGDIRSDLVMNGQSAFVGCDAVIHLIGIITEIRGAGQTFAAIHVQGTRNVVRAATDAGIRRFIYLSAQGASLEARSEYARTKAQAEAIIRESRLDAAIFRPSVVVGKDGEFVKQMRSLVRRPPLSPFPLPFIPVPGSGKNLLQPLWIDDLVKAIVDSLHHETTAEAIYEIGGADAVTLNELLLAFARESGIEKRLLHLPLSLMFPIASILEALLPRPPITVDQLIQLRTDNICDNTTVTESFGIHPIGFAEILSRLKSTR